MKHVLAALAFMLPVAAQAEWREATSENFVIYADDEERDIRRLAERLELYHGALEAATAFDAPAPSPSNRVTIYVVGGRPEMRRIFGQNAERIGGFYIARAGASSAFVPRPEATRGPVDFSTGVVLHEYAHHFLRAVSTMPMPIWFDEGGAEFFAAAEFPAEGGIVVGRAATHRAGELLYLRDVKAEQVLDAGPEFYRRGIERGFESFYGKSWLLFHHLMFEPSRRGQLGKYTALLSSGKTSREAGIEAFGDLIELERDLDRYLGSELLAMRFGPEQLRNGQVAVRVLGAGEAEMMPIRMRSRRIVAGEQAAELVRQARGIAAGFPADPAVLAALAEAENLAGNHAEALAAAEAALAGDPAQVNAHMQKGYALFQQAPRAADPAAAYEAAVEAFLALNRIENDHPQPLIFYYRSFAERGVRPPAGAVRGLERAAELAPFDMSVRMALAVHYLQVGQPARARPQLEPIAFSPHGGAMADSARKVIERIDRGGDPPPSELLALLGLVPGQAGGD